MFIHQHKREWPVSVMCAVLEVHPSGYYAWVQRPPSTKRDRHRTIVLEMRNHHRKSRRASGSRRLRKSLSGAGIRVGRHLLRRLMREDGIVAKRTPNQRVTTTDSNHSHRIAPNHLNRDFQAAMPNQKWCADFTYIPTSAGFVYLAVVLDLFSRRVVGWHVADTMTQELTITALKRAMRLRKYPKNVLVHTDRGSQYAADVYRDILRGFGGIASMSRKGDPWDNAPMESFFATLKIEAFDEITFKDVDHVRTEALQYIENEYNRSRLHSTIGYSTPVQFERAFNSNKQMTITSV